MLVVPTEEELEEAARMDELGFEDCVLQGRRWARRGRRVDDHGSHVRQLLYLVADDTRVAIEIRRVHNHRVSMAEATFDDDESSASEPVGSLGQ